jgi:prepilin-type processing-associated H-X9-DG protein
MGLILPAVQNARESARRAECASQLRQLGIAAAAHTSAKGHLPPGVHQWYFSASVSHRGIPLFAYLLPYLEQSTVLLTWDYVDPMNNSDQGRKSNTAVILPLLVCPSDVIEENPVEVRNGWVYALGSYGGNGGTRSYFPLDSKADGLFHTTGEASEPEREQEPVRLQEIKDGLSQTILFGERSHSDDNYRSFNDAGFGEPLNEWGWWGASTSRKMIGHVTMSAHAPINYRLPFDYGSRDGRDPPASNFAQFQHYVDLRVCAYGSNHPDGANFCLADGSVQFLSSVTPPSVLVALSTRAGEETPVGP